MILTDNEIRIAAQSWVGLTDAPNPNATSFAAGAKFVLQKLEQCSVSGSLPTNNDYKIVLYYVNGKPSHFTDSRQ